MPEFSSPYAATMRTIAEIYDVGWDFYVKQTPERCRAVRTNGVRCKRPTKDVERQLCGYHAH